MLKTLNFGMAGTVGTALVASLFVVSAQAETVSVAVAANFTAPMQEIAAQFAKDTEHQAQLSFGATGKFYAQISNAAPFEVLLSADEATPKKLASEGLADESSRFTYATGRLALWSAKSNYVSDNDQILKSNEWTHLAIANPKLAPYGAAAIQVLEKLNLKDSVQARFVQGENIAQTYQFAATGNAQIGFVALSQVMKDGQIKEGSAWIVPADLHDPIRQDAILLNTGAKNPAASALMQYLRGEKARAIIQAYGYE